MHEKSLQKLAESPFRIRRFFAINVGPIIKINGRWRSSLDRARPIKPMFKPRLTLAARLHYYKPGVHEIQAIRRQKHYLTKR